MRKSEKQDLIELHAKALKAFDSIQSALRDERLQCLQDRRFYSIAGAQWEGPIGEQFENKPKFEVNKIHLAVLRIINEYRNNRITVDFVSKDGSTDTKLAETCDGLFRADERDSCAEEAYDNAFEEAVGGGFGALRLRACYEDEEDPDNDKQRIKIEPIYDADSSVFFDLDSRRQDKADAKYCFVVYSTTKEAFEEEWGEDVSSWPKEVHQHEFDWITPDVVFLAEYYAVEEDSDESVTYTGASGDEVKVLQSVMDADRDVLGRLHSTGYQETRRKPVKVKKVHKYILSGNSILEDCGFIAGKCIPIIPVYGKRWFVDNIERCMGHVRLVKDAQRLKNMQLSKLGELSALSSVQKPILLPEQVAGHEVMWTEDNLKNYPYLLVNPITGSDGSAQPVNQLAYTQAPSIPPAMAALLQITDADMQSILGNQQEADKMVSHVSGKAVEMIQTRMDMQTFIYVSNFAKAVRRVGEVWLSIANEIYVEPGRMMKTLGSDGELGRVELMTPMLDENQGTIQGNDLSKAKFDVFVDVGPSFISRREATVASIISMLQYTQDQETSSVLQAMAIMNMDGEGVSDVRDFFRKRLVKMGALKPTEEEEKELAAQAKEKSAQDKALEAMAEEAQAKAVKARAEVLKTMAGVELANADVELTKAKTMETLAGVDMDTTRSAMELYDRENTQIEQTRPQQMSVPDVPSVKEVQAQVPAAPNITLHIHNDGTIGEDDDELVTRLQSIERGPGGEMIGAEIVKEKRKKKREVEE